MMGRKLLFLGVTCSFIFFIGCGGGGEKASSESKASSDEAAVSQPTEKEAVAAPTGTASITGTINFQGQAPKVRKLKLDEDCAKLHTQDILSEKVVINENGTLRNVFVHITKGLEGYKFAPSPESAVFDQKGCRYEPHVMGVQAGQKMKILNSDPFLHNIHALPKTNRPFNFGMPKQGDEKEKVFFKKTEVMVKVKCDVHPWMNAYVGVVDHPFFSVSSDDGSFSIQNLPAGEYVLEAWHEKYGTMTQAITVGDNETKTADFTFGKSAS